MKISLITVSFNSAKTIATTFDSIQAQTHTDCEHIVIDGGSVDGTIEIIKSATHIHHWISEPDRGIYDAMNKGLKLATGEIIGILNSDDFYASDKILDSVAKAFEDPAIDTVYGDLNIVDSTNLSRVVRRYSSAGWEPSRFKWGFMPAHPTFFARSHVYKSVGEFKTDYAIAADYEMLIRMLYVHRFTSKYLPLTMVTMRKGGVSSNGLQSNIVLNREILRACRENGIRTNYAMIYSKYFKKIFELLR
ncbi:MAG TPA: glycosyltransferase family 2 protein [Cyclobacteriaceae bacterium]|nr:glycosyltransferase family 2 protein [Cyclobacteriaceae bacterium]